MLFKRFRFNIFFKSLGEVAARFSSLLFYAMGARLLGAEQFGLFSLSFSYAFILVVLIDFGTNSILTRELARDHNRLKSIMATVTTFKAILIVPTVIIVHLLVVFLNYDAKMVLVTDLVCLAALGTAFGEHLSAVLSGLERMDIEAYLKMIWKLGSLVCAYVAFKLFGTIESFVVGMAMGLWIGVFCGFVWIRMRVGALFSSFDLPFLKSLLKTSSPLFIAWIFIFLYDNQDIYFLSGFSFSNEDIGLFSASAKLIDAMRPLPVLFMGAVFPILSEASLKDKILTVKIIKPLLSQSINLLFPFVLTLSLLAPLVCRIVYGSEFSVTSTVFTIAVWGFLGVFVNHLLFQMLVSLDGQKQFLQGSILVMGIHAVLCYFLFPSLGIIGGAWAFLGSEVALFIFNLNALTRKIEEGRMEIMKAVIKPFPLIAAVFVIVVILEAMINIYFLLAGALIVYALFSLKFGLFDWNLLVRLKNEKK